MDNKYLEILVCPVSKGKLTYRPDLQELWCQESKLAYPIKDGIPFMLENEARVLSDKELDA